jgi:hypothetical protein
MKYQLNKQCEGCTLYKKNLKENKFQCRIIIDDKSNSCPCRECIIKTTCEILCDEWKRINNPGLIWFDDGKEKEY